MRNIGLTTGKFVARRWRNHADFSRAANTFLKLTLFAQGFQPFAALADIFDGQDMENTGAQAKPHGGLYAGAISNCDLVSVTPGDARGLDALAARQWRDPAPDLRHLNPAFRIAAAAIRREACLLKGEPVAQRADGLPVHRRTGL